jgi:hypothetical protein
MNNEDQHGDLINSFTLNNANQASDISEFEPFRLTS